LFLSALLFFAFLPSVFIQLSVIQAMAKSTVEKDALEVTYLYPVHIKQ